MWTVKGKESLLNGANEALRPGAKVELFAEGVSLCVINVPFPASHVENGMLVLATGEALALVRGTADRAEISGENGVVLIELSVPDEMVVEPVEIIPGAMVAIKSVVIK